MNDNQKWEIIQGDALKVLSGFAPNTFDAVITVPVCFRRPDTIREKQVHRQEVFQYGGERATSL